MARKALCLGSLRRTVLHRAPDSAVSEGRVQTIKLHPRKATSVGACSGRRLRPAMERYAAHEPDSKCKYLD